MLYNTIKFENSVQLNTFVNIFETNNIILDSEKLIITTYDENLFDVMLGYISSNNCEVNLLKIEKE